MTAGPCSGNSNGMQRAALELTPQFLMRRIAQEEAAARIAADPRARNSHLELARRYRDACNAPAAAPLDPQPLGR